MEVKITEQESKDSGKIVGVRVPAFINEELSRIAKECCLSVSGIIRLAMLDYIRKYNKENPAKLKEGK